MIQADNLSKRYVLDGRFQAMTVRDLVTGLIGGGRSAREEQRELWALKDVSFSIEKGEAVGLIGNNGAGKSTLLKILSRIVRPTSGSAVLRGRTGSLLEVGTGFHRELSGSENIFLNGAVLGMKRSEIKARFDEIVGFAEVERFIDTPIKFYSTGMFMRLAFAVAAHLDPEILLVDEVLAVGDVSFQKKCLQKMQDIGDQGRTIIFVSHNMSAITRLCSRAIWLENGVINEDAESGTVVANYLKSQTKTSGERSWDSILEAPGNETVRLRKVRVFGRDQAGLSALDIRKPVFIEITYDLLREGETIIPAFQLYNDANLCLFTSKDLAPATLSGSRIKGRYSSTAQIPPNLLSEGSFFVNVLIASFEPWKVHVNEPEAVSFLITDTLEGDSARGAFVGEIEGVVRPKLEWDTRVEEEE